MIRLKLHLQYAYIERTFYNIKEAYDFIQELGRQVVSYQMENI